MRIFAGAAQAGKVLERGDDAGFAQPAGKGEGLFRHKGRAGAEQAPHVAQTGTDGRPLHVHDRRQIHIEAQGAHLRACLSTQGAYIGGFHAPHFPCGRQGEESACRLEPGHAPPFLIHGDEQAPARRLLQ